MLDVIKDLKGQGLMGMSVIRTFIGRRVLPLKMRHHHQWEFQGSTNPTIESRVTIREDDLDQWVMKVMGEYTLDHERGSPRRPLAPGILHGQTDLSSAWSHTHRQFLLTR